MASYYRHCIIMHVTIGTAVQLSTSWDRCPLRTCVTRLGCPSCCHTSSGMSCSPAPEGCRLRCNVQVTTQGTTNLKPYIHYCLIHHIQSLDDKRKRLCYNQDEYTSLPFKSLYSKVVGWPLKNGNYLTDAGSATCPLIIHNILMAKSPTDKIYTTVRTITAHKQSLFLRVVG